MSTQLLVSDLPDDVILMILGYLSYDNVAHIRIVNSFFNRACKLHLNRGFNKVQKMQSDLLRKLESKLPRRESARANHPYFRHCYILKCIGNSNHSCSLLSISSNTFGKYIDANLCCFIPGKIIDEVYNIFNILRNQEIPHQAVVLRELRDICSMANEHFEAEIMPGLKEQLQLQNNQKEDEEPSSSLNSPQCEKPISQNKFSKVRNSKFKFCFHASWTFLFQALSKLKGKILGLERKQNERIENLEQTVAAQAEMLKEMNKKLLESEQKTATLFKITKNQRRMIKKISNNGQLAKTIRL